MDNKLKDMKKKRILIVIGLFIVFAFSGAPANYTYTLEIPEVHITELIEVFGFDWSQQITGDNGTQIANPQTKAQYAEEMFDKYVKRSIHKRVMSYRRANTSINNTPITGN